MTNAIITWFDHEEQVIKADFTKAKPVIISWGEKFLADILPVLKKAATDAVITAATIPGDGATKFAAATAAATADLVQQGVPVVENDVKAAVQIAYHNLPQTVQSNEAVQAVEAKVEGEVERAADKVDPAAGA